MEQYQLIGNNLLCSSFCSSTSTIQRATLRKKTQGYVHGMHPYLAPPKSNLKGCIPKTVTALKINIIYQCLILIPLIKWIHSNVPPISWSFFSLHLQPISQATSNNFHDINKSCIFYNNLIPKGLRNPFCTISSHCNVFEYFLMFFK
jgi:hypothetical protein